MLSGDMPLQFSHHQMLLSFIPIIVRPRWTLGRDEAYQALH